MEYVSRSSYRRKVLIAIGEDVKMPFQIANDSNIPHYHISKTLKQLREKELIELINPEMHRGRLYRLTIIGKQVLSKMWYLWKE